MPEAEGSGERRVGALSGAQRDSVGLAKAGRPKIGLEQNKIIAPASLAAAGIDKHLADRARDGRRYAAVAVPIRASIVAGPVSRLRDSWRKSRSAAPGWQGATTENIGHM